MCIQSTSQIRHSHSGTVHTDTSGLAIQRVSVKDDYLALCRHARVGAARDANLYLPAQRGPERLLERQQHRAQRRAVLSAHVLLHAVKPPAVVLGNCAQAEALYGEAQE